MDYLLPIVYALVGVALIWALIELVRLLRSMRGMVEDTNANVAPLMGRVNDMVADAAPAAKRIDPMLERVNLTVDAANLELMRVDGILENVDAITGHVANAASEYMETLQKDVVETDV